MSKCDLNLIVSVIPFKSLNPVEIKGISESLFRLKSILNYFRKYSYSFHKTNNFLVSVTKCRLQISLLSSHSCDHLLPALPKSNLYYYFKLLNGWPDRVPLHLKLEFTLFYVFVDFFSFKSIVNPWVFLRS